MRTYRIYLGYDEREKKAYDVARFSFLRRTSDPKQTIVFPVELEHLRLNGILNRPVEKKDGKLWCPISQAPMATEFAISRFAVPFMAKKGWALFADCDVVCFDDVAKLFDLADEKYALMCVKHNYRPAEQTKMDGQIQTTYFRKNWSSVMLFNCDHPSNSKLTLETLNKWPGRDLHAFTWLKEEEIGSLPAKWNQLVGVNEPITKEGIVHWTLGGPWFKDWKGANHDQMWLDEAKDAQ